MAVSFVSDRHHFGVAKFAPLSDFSVQIMLTGEPGGKSWED
jgi:hypothetical protein